MLLRALNPTWNYESKNFYALTASQSARERVCDSHMRVAMRILDRVELLRQDAIVPRDESGRRVAEQAGESLQLACTEVRHRPIGDAVCRPRDHIIAPRALRSVDGDRRIRNGSEADEVLAAAIDQRRHRCAAHHI